MKLQAVIYCLILNFVSVCSAAEYFRSVLVASDANFHSTIHNPEAKYTFMNFYSPSCTHCNKLGPQYTILAELFKGTQVQVAQVDAKQNVKTRTSEKILGFPTMRMYGFDGTHVGSYKGERLADDMAKWITQMTGVKPKYPDSRVSFVKGDEIRNVVDVKGNVIAFVAPWLEDWGQKITQFERTSWGYQYLNFFQADATKEENAEVISDLRITKFPTLMYFQEDGKLKVLMEKDLNENKIRLFLDDDNIGELYENAKDFIREQSGEGEEDEKVVGTGYGFNKNYDKYDNVNEEEMYRKLREL